MKSEPEILEVLVYWSNEDNAYIAEIPDLPGCMADGETPVAAFEMVQIVAREWIETAVDVGRREPSASINLAFRVREIE